MASHGTGRGESRARRSPHPAEVLLQLSPPTTAVDVRVLLGQSLAEVRAGRLTPQLSYAISSLATTFLRALDVGDYETRITQLERFREELRNGRQPN